MLSRQPGHKFGLLWADKKNLLEQEEIAAQEDIMTLSNRFINKNRDAKVYPLRIPLYNLSWFVRLLTEYNLLLSGEK